MLQQQRQEKERQSLSQVLFCRRVLVVGWVLGQAPPEHGGQTNRHIRVLLFPVALRLYKTGVLSFSLVS